MFKLGLVFLENSKNLLLEFLRKNHVENKASIEKKYAYIEENQRTIQRLSLRNKWINHPPSSGTLHFLYTL